MLDTLYCLAAALALVGASAGNRVAWPLLGSFTFYWLAQWQGWQFDRNLWATVDCVVLTGIIIVLANDWRKAGWSRGWLPHPSVFLVLGLFGPLLYSYTLEPAPAHVLSMLAGIAQLLLTFPLRTAWARARSMPREPDKWNEFDLMAAA